MGIWCSVNLLWGMVLKKKKNYKTLFSIIYRACEEQVYEQAWGSFMAEMLCQSGF